MALRFVDLVLHAVVTCCMWMATVGFLPIFLIIKCNRSIRENIFSFLLLKVMYPIFGSFIADVKKELLVELKKTPGKKGRPLKVLEIGVAEGKNFSYYPPNSLVTALDSNSSMKSYFDKNLLSYPDIKLDRFIIGSAECMEDIEDNSMDIVVATFLLCSVTDNEAVVKEIKRVLAPGGKYFAAEHIAYPSDEWSYYIQKITDPIWSVLFCGCHLTRPSRDLITKTGFTSFTNWIVEPRGLPLYIRRILLGIATK